MVTKLRESKFNKIKAIIDFEDKTPHFVSLETANGKLIASGGWSIDAKKTNMHIFDVLVQEKYRGMGYGSLLARIMISIAKFYKLETITLIDGSTLEGFWQRLGFVWRGRRHLWVLDLKEVK